MDKCFCHLNGYAVKDSTARARVEEVNTELTNKINEIPKTDLTNYYTKSEVDTKIDEIPETDLTNYYTKEEVDNALSGAGDGGEKLSDHDIYTIQINGYNLKGSQPTITDEESLNKFSEILTKIYNRELEKNTGHHNSLLIVYSQEDVYMFRYSTYGNTFYGTFVEEPIDTNGYTNAWKMAVTGSFNDSTKVYTVTKVKFSRESVRTLLTTNSVSFTPTGDYQPATKKYVDDKISPLQSDVNTLKTNHGITRVGLSSDVTVPSETRTKVPMDTIINITDDYELTSDGGIKILDPTITKCIVKGKARFGTSGNVYLSLSKNGNEESSYTYQNVNVRSTVEDMTFINVAQNDVLYLYVYTEGANSVIGGGDPPTWVTLEIMGI